MKVLITGATGLVGQAIIKELENLNIDYCFLTTSKEKLIPNKSFYWQPKNNQIDKNAFENVTHIINLAGSSISKPWTSSYKKEILNSRIEALQTLFNFLKNESHQVKHLITASAIGIYPSDENKIYDENEMSTNPEFLGQTVKKWEEATLQFSTLKLPISIIRIGIVFDKNNGALPQIVKPIKYFAGAVMGNGNQWLSWIHIEDLAKIFTFFTQNQLVGIFNAAAPNPITNKNLTYLIAKNLKRKIFLPSVPKFMMKLILGERHALLFDSQKVSSNKIMKEGFIFKHIDLENSIKKII